MTGIDVKPAERESRSSAPDLTFRKARLFCQVCGHESLVDGDWRITDACSGHALVCPECGHVLEAR